MKSTLHVTPLRGPNGQAESRDAIRTRLGEAESDGPPVEVTPPAKMDADDILQVTSDTNIDLVVANVSAHSGMQKRECAAVVRELLAHLACPVLVPGASTNLTSLEQILVPTDLSDHALHALRQAAGLARLFEASVEVVHVVESMPYVALTEIDRLSLGPMSLSEHRGRRNLRAFLQQGHVPHVPMESQLAYGDPAEQIRRYAADDDIDLLVLSSHGTGARQDRPWGHVTDQLLEQVPCSLLLLPTFGSDLPSTPLQASS